MPGITEYEFLGKKFRIFLQFYNFSSILADLDAQFPGLLLAEGNQGGPLVNFQSLNFLLTQFNNFLGL